MSDCYKCKHRGTVSGSAHSSCRHLEFKDLLADPAIQLLCASSKRAIPRVVDACATVAKVYGIKLNEHGVKNCWALFPVNFDPVWVESCELFEEK